MTLYRFDEKPDASSREGVPGQTALEIVVLAALYFALGKFGLSLAFLNASASAVWPPTGLALAALLLRGYRLWPGVFLGAFLVNITTQGSLATTLGIAAGNTIEALLGTWLVSRFARGARGFERTQTIFIFVALALLSTAVSASIGVTTLCLGKLASWHQYLPIWLTWWSGDSVSDLVVAPLLLAWVVEPVEPPRAKQTLELCALFLAVLVVCGIGFWGGIPIGNKNAPLAYLCILPLIWAAFRLGRRGAVTAAFLTSSVAIWATLHDLGPFVSSQPNQSLLLLQAFIGTLTLTSSVLASVVEERRRAEASLRESEARKSAVLESALDCIITMNEAGKIIDFNPAAERTFGWRQEEIAGKTVGETIVPPELRKAHAQGLATFLAMGEGPILDKRVEMTALHANGTKFPVELAISVTRLEGRPPFFTAYLRDLSERKKREAALARAQSDLKRYAEGLEQTVADRTEKLSRTVGELEAFSYSLSHDLRAPLRAIHGFSQAVLEDHRDKLGPRAADMLGRVIASANRMERLIRSVLAFTQVSQQEIKVERVDVEKLIRELIQERPELQAAEIRISSPLLAVLGDDASLTQCITNLLGNAVKFVAREVRPEVEISTEAKGERVRVWFVDNGIGIGEGGQKRLFGLFERQHGSEDYEGTGMGLAIVRKAAQRMNGEVGVESELGKGSRFWIELPKAD